MQKTLKLMNEFEERNNISTFMEFHSDGSGVLRELWEGEGLQEFKSLDELNEFLKKNAI